MVYWTEDSKKIVRMPAADMMTFYGRAKHLYYIRTKDNQLVPYIPNQGQLLLGNIIEEEIARAYKETGLESCRVIILKPRQIGATTDTALRILDFMLRLPMCYGIVLNHLGEDTDLVFDKYKIAYDNLPDFVELTDEKGDVILDPSTGTSLIPFKPTEDSNSAKQLRFGNMTKSWLNVRTAGSGDNIGKGSSINCCHFTESANYDHYEKVLSSVNQMLSRISTSFVVNESTANGTTGAGRGFYETWIRSDRAWKRFIEGETATFEGFRPVFIPWYVIDEYRLPLQDGKLVDIEDINFGTPENKRKFLEREQMLITEYGVTLDRINWYRWNIKINCEYRLADANRYYPTFPEDAFLATDKCFFDSNKLQGMKAQFDNGTKKVPAETGYLDEFLMFVPSATGELTVFEEPDLSSSNRYIVSCDMSKGVEDGDYTSMYVFDRLEEKFVAHWHGRMAEDLVAQELMKLGIWYGHALVIPENNMGTVINIIKPDGLMPYDGPLYYKMTGRESLDYGYHTLGNTRKILLDEYSAWLRTNYDKLPDVNTVNEHLKFVRTVSTGGTVKYQADAGAKDDRVISAALCIVAHNWWDEEIGIMNEKRTDYLSVVKVNRLSSMRTGFRQSELGMSSVSRVQTPVKKLRQSQVGGY